MEVATYIFRGILMCALDMLADPCKILNLSITITIL